MPGYVIASAAVKEIHNGVVGVMNSQLQLLLTDGVFVSVLMELEIRW